MTLQNILSLSVAFLLTTSRLSCGTPTVEAAAGESNGTTSESNQTSALVGAHHVLQVLSATNGSLLNHDVQSAYVTCYSDSTCWTSAGFNSRCYNNYCICDIGYHSSNGRCISTSCSYDYQCTAYQARTRCSFNSCVCDYGYYRQTSSQTCLYYGGDGGGAGEAVGFSFGGFIFLIIIISVCVICCRRRRDRIIRVVGPPAAGARVQQQQQPRAGPGFVQPQPGYYQQNPQGYQQSYQQQQPAMPMPQPVAYPNPNYQQQQQQAPPPYNPAFAAAPASGYPPIGGKM